MNLCGGSRCPALGALPCVCTCITTPHAADGLSLLLPPHQDVQEDQPQPPQNSPLPDGPVAATSTPQPVPAAGGQAEKAVPNKSLLDWLRQQSDYTLDVPSFGTVRVACSGTSVCLSVCLLCVLPFVLGFLQLLWSSGLPQVSQMQPFFPYHGLWCSPRLSGRFITCLGGGHSERRLLSCVLPPQGPFCSPSASICPVHS